MGDVYAAMGIAGFGKTVSKKTLDPARFDKTKRNAKEPTKSLEPASAAPTDTPQEQEYDPEHEFPIDDEVDLPASHELILKDHTKVVSALALDVSGARIVSGSHDYDCKLWDFGGMDSRCKPFKSWEPSGSYHVRTWPDYHLPFRPDGSHRYMT